jgi:hypothetical protein
MQPYYFIRFRHPDDGKSYYMTASDWSGTRHRAGRVKAADVAKLIEGLQSTNPDARFKAVGTIPESVPWGHVDHLSDAFCVDCRPSDRRYLRTIRPAPGVLACSRCTCDMFDKARPRLDLLPDQEARKRELNRAANRKEGED